jgi:hypothetical protein
MKNKLLLISLIFYTNIISFNLEETTYKKNAYLALASGFLVSLLTKKIFPTIKDKLNPKIIALSESKKTKHKSSKDICNPNDIFYKKRSKFIFLNTYYLDSDSIKKAEETTNTIKIINTSKLINFTNYKINYHSSNFFLNPPYPEKPYTKYKVLFGTLYFFVINSMQILFRALFIATGLLFFVDTKNKIDFKIPLSLITLTTAIELFGFKKLK